jgi:hypothetical protein
MSRFFYVYNLWQLK